MPVTQITTPDGHTIIPGRFTTHQEPATILVPLTLNQLVALVELDVGVQSMRDLPDGYEALWSALSAMDDHEGTFS